MPDVSPQSDQGSLLQNARGEFRKGPITVTLSLLAVILAGIVFVIGDNQAGWGKESISAPPTTEPPSVGDTAPALSPSSSPEATPSTPLQQEAATEPTAEPTPTPKVRTIRLPPAGPCGYGHPMVHVDIDRPRSVQADEGPDGWSEDVDFKYGDECFGEGDGIHAADNVDLGIASTGKVSADECRDAAMGMPVGAELPARDLAAGTSLCAVTTENAVALIRITRVAGRATKEVYPALYMTITLWSS